MVAVAFDDGVGVVIRMALRRLTVVVVMMEVAVMMTAWSKCLPALHSSVEILTLEAMVFVGGAFGGE